MALTFTEVATPTTQLLQWTAAAGPLKFRVVDVTFDSSYPTTGEVMLATDIGWVNVIGALPLSEASNAAATLGMMCVVKPNAGKTQLTLQLMGYDGAAAGKASFEEKANAFDASTFTVRLLVIGF